MPRPVPDFTYRGRSRDGLVFRKPRRLDIERARMIRRRYLSRESTQMELALEHDVSQSTISRIISNTVYYERSR